MTTQAPQAPRRASETIISMSQVVLGPLDAIFKAQIHAARAFVSNLLQMGYPHRPGNKPIIDPATGAVADDARPYMLEFVHEVEIDGVIKQRQIRVPALAVMPLAPLAVEAAKFSFNMAVKEINKNTNLKVSEAEEAQQPRPWFLVHEPVSINGTIAPPDVQPGSSGEREREEQIHIEIKVATTKVPAGLEKLLVSLTQLTEVKELPTKARS